MLTNKIFPITDHVSPFPVLHLEPAPRDSCPYKDMGVTGGAVLQTCSFPQRLETRFGPVCAIQAERTKPPQEKPGCTRASR